MYTLLDPLNHAGRQEALARFGRVFGNRRLPKYEAHLNRLTNGKPWFAFVGNNVAKCFTRLTKLDVADKSRLSLLNYRKFTANGGNNGYIF